MQGLSLRKEVLAAAGRNDSFRIHSTANGQVLQAGVVFAIKGQPSVAAECIEIAEFMVSNGLAQKFCEGLYLLTQGRKGRGDGVTGLGVGGSARTIYG